MLQFFLLFFFFCFVFFWVFFFFFFFCVCVCVCIFFSLIIINRFSQTRSAIFFFFFFFFFFYFFFFPNKGSTRSDYCKPSHTEKGISIMHLKAKSLFRLKNLEIIFYFMYLKFSLTFYVNSY